MNSGGYTVEVTSLSPNASEKDVYEFFAFSGEIEQIEIIRSGEYACTAYVTFEDPHSLENAVLLSGATIVDQRVCITPWGQYTDQVDFWNRPTWKIDDETVLNTHATHANQFVSTPGEAVTMAQEVVVTMLSKGYVLGKDALIKAKALDESYQVSASAAAKVYEVSKRIGLTDKIMTGFGAVKSVDESYRVSEITKTVASATGRTAAVVAHTVVNSTYFSKGALWVSNALTRAAKAAADLGTPASKN
ncbi:hypothetical protein MKX01_038937 [Papaver californicum]|nr:hypothetical protein MKX01_038937 [Papaver californicum]